MIQAESKFSSKTSRSSNSDLQLVDNDDSINTAQLDPSPSHTPQSSNSELPLFGTPAQSTHDDNCHHHIRRIHLLQVRSPPHTPAQSVSAIQLPSQSKIFLALYASAQPQPQVNVAISQSHVPSAIPSPPHTPRSSSTASPPHTPAQSVSTIQLPSQSKFSSVAASPQPQP